MKLADRIRDAIVKTYVDPARAEGRDEVCIRAGDVHAAMGLRDRLPAVCGALRAGRFLVQAGAELIDHSGPANGANAIYHFRLAPSAVQQQFTGGSGRLAASGDEIMLISCVKSKLPHAAPARDLYTSALFRGAKNAAERSGRPWYILSAQHGFVAPDHLLEPYERTLNDMKVEDRQAWSSKVFHDLMLAHPNLRRVTIFAGRRYRQFLESKLTDIGIEVQAPLAHLGLGQQLAWFAERS